MWPFPLQTPGPWSACLVSPRQSPQKTRSCPEQAPGVSGSPLSFAVVLEEDADRVATTPSPLP